MSIKPFVERNFSRHAGRYDAYTATQKVIGASLLEHLGPHPFATILDIGCGTGHYTQLLHQKYPQARITAIDLSAAMIEQARQKLSCDHVEFIVADIETMEFDTAFDLITSNACFQWLADLDKTIAKCVSSLTETGLLAFSSLGPQTFRELADCLDSVLSDHPAISAQSFVDKPELKTLLQRYFPRASVTSEAIVETYPSLLDLLNTIKYAGTRGRGLKGLALTKTQLHNLEKTYRRRIGSIAATYDVFYGLAGKKEVPSL